MVHNRFFNPIEKPPVDENVRAEPHEPVQFFMIYQLELRDIQPDLREEPFYKRLAAAVRLKSLSSQETRNCVERGLRAQNWENYPAFDSKAFQIIHQFSGGEPHRIAVLCNHLLLQCFVEQLPRITAANANAQAMLNELRRKQLVPPESQSRKLPAHPPCGPHSSEEPLGEEPVLNECPPVEKYRLASPLPSDTPVSSGEKAKFESRDVSHMRNRGRGNW
jgi:hypothetical protein